VDDIIEKDPYTFPACIFHNFKRESVKNMEVQELTDFVHNF